MTSLPDHAKSPAPCSGTLLVNGHDDVVVDPEWGVTTFGTEQAALEAAILSCRR